MTFRHIRNARGFFSDYYLGSIFGRGEGRGRRKALSDRETDRAYERFRWLWTRADQRAEDAPSCREQFVRPFLSDILGFHLGMGEDLIYPLYRSVEAEAAGGQALLAVGCGAWDQDFDADKGKARKKLENTLSHLGLAHGILVSGERLRLIRAPGEGVAGSYLEVDLEGLASEEDQESFAAFVRLLRHSEFVPGEDGKRGIERVEEESRRHAEKVSEDLKRAVFASTETLVSALIEDAVMRGDFASATAIPEAGIRVFRDAGLAGLYRILFILYAEARDSRLIAHGLYQESYALSTLVEELLREPFRDRPDNRFTLGTRLSALFRLYDAGLSRSAEWDNIPPRGGHFFASTTPEGKVLARAALSDRSVARLLLDVATTAPRRGVGRERVSFRELDIESLGSVYEGLLEFEPRVAQETRLEVRVQGKTFILSAADTARLCREKHLSLSGDFSFVAGTEAETLHPEAPADNADAEEDEDDELDGDDDTDEQDTAEDDAEKGVRKGATAHLVRRLESGEFHFVPGSARKGSGAFYTPQELVKDLVRHALGPQVAGRGSAAIEALRILDPACGSAHFLVEAMRFLGRELHRAYVEEYGTAGPPHFRGTAGQGWDPEWEAADEASRSANSEARAWCKRRVAERCLFGVDLNPTAVSLAHVALWIESLAGDRPLTFFEHHFRCGNSLLGTWLDRLDQPPLPSIPHKAGGTVGLFADFVRRAIHEAAGLRRLIDVPDPDSLTHEGIDPETVEELDFKERQQRKADEILASARLLFDLRSASAFLPEIWGEWRALCGLVDDAEELRRYASSRSWWPAFELIRRRERFFHWELEFPEVFLDPEHPGFDAVLGNPPWDEVRPKKVEFYASRDVLIRAYAGAELERRIRELNDAEPGLGAGFRDYASRLAIFRGLLRQEDDFPLGEAASHLSRVDLSKYFLDRAIRLACGSGSVGMLVPSVVYNGDACIGLRRFFLGEAHVERFYGFENRQKLFPIDSRYKFVNVVLRKGFHSATFDAAFMRHDPEELRVDSSRPWTVRMSASEIERLSPETLAFLEYRSARDQEIAQRMHHERPTLEDTRTGNWGSSLFDYLRHDGIYNNTWDDDLWRDASTQRLFSPEAVLGRVPADMGETIQRMRSAGFLPVFEGKQLDQFIVGRQPVRKWLSVDAAVRKYGKPPSAAPLCVYRRIARNTDARTSIAVVLPPGSCATESMAGLLLERVSPDAAAAVLNSFAYDWILRMRSAGSTIAFTYTRPMPVPPADVVNGLPRVSTRLTWETGVRQITDDHSAWPLLWEANRAVAEAYGLNPDDFEHILASFPVMARKRSDFFGYLRERLAEWKAGKKNISIA